MRRALHWPALLVMSWLLIAPPGGGVPSDAWHDRSCGDPGHLDPCAALTQWRRFGEFDGPVECRSERRRRIATAPDDETWSDYQLSRCVPRERLYQGRLTPEERAEQ